MVERLFYTKSTCSLSMGNRRYAASTRHLGLYGSAPLPIWFHVIPTIPCDDTGNVFSSFFSSSYWRVSLRRTPTQTNIFSPCWFVRWQLNHTFPLRNSWVSDEFSSPQKSKEVFPQLELTPNTDGVFKFQIWYFSSVVGICYSRCTPAVGDCSCQIWSNTWTLCGWEGWATWVKRYRWTVVRQESKGGRWGEEEGMID